MSAALNEVITPSASSPPSVPTKTSVVIGLPHNGMFHASFVLSLIESINVLINSGKYTIMLSPGQSSFVPFSRMKTLGLDVLRGKNQKVFNDQSFDVFVSLDSDIVFSPIQLMELIESTKLQPVVSGVYCMADGKHLAVVKDWDKAYFAEHGTFPFMEPKELDPYVTAFTKELEERREALERKETLGPLSTPELMKVSYAGMGFFACRKEVLDALQYPYFHRELQRVRGKDGKDLVDMCSEDVALCHGISDAGFTVYINTRLRVGHEKLVVL